MSTNDLQITTLLALVRPLVLIGVGSLAVRGLRWAKRNRARAAAVMNGTYLNDVEGGKIDVNDAGVIDGFINWFSDLVDGVDSGAGSSSGGGWDGSDGGGYDSGG